MQPSGGRAFGDQSGYLHSGRNNFPAFAGPGALASSGKYADDTASQYSYAPKSKLIYSRKNDSQKRSRTGGKSGALRRTGSSAVGPYVEDHETRSRLSKASVQRFNEQPEKSTTKSVKSGSMRSKVLSQSMGKKMGDDQLQQYLNLKGAGPVGPYEADPNAEAMLEEEKEVAFEDVDNVEALPDSVSQVKPTQS